jgi:hypothetical protein
MRLKRLIEQSHHHHHTLKHPHLAFGLAGILSLIWLLVRAGFKPTRLQYPCQRAALATLLASLSYWTGVLGLMAAACAFRRRLSRLMADRRGKTAAMAVGFVFCWLMLVLILTAGHHPSPSRAGTTLTVPSWTNPGAISDVFVVQNAPVPAYSLDGGDLPPGATQEEAFSDVGMNALIDLMIAQNTPFYRTEATPNGLFASDDVVVIKINNQWSYGPSQRYNHTRIDLVKGLIYRLVRHPDGFTGAVIIGENTQGTRPDLDTQEYNNAEDPLTSYQDVANAFASQGYRVATSYWDAFGSYFVTEFSAGNTEDGYVTGAATGGSGVHELAWPKFSLEIGGTTYRISMRYGLWNGSAYEPSRLKMINFPVMKAHGMAGATLALKNYIGFLTITNPDPLFADWDGMHGYFWGYQNLHPGYGLLGRQIAQVRRADLDIIDAIWINPAGNTDDADSCVREDLILASTDPVALDYYASSRILSQVAFSPADVSAATHGGTFRNFMLCIENRLRAEGMTDIINLDDSMTQAQEEAQFNVFVVDAAGPIPVTPTPTGTELIAATATDTPAFAPSATPIRTFDLVPDCRVDNLDLMSLLAIVHPEGNVAADLFDFARFWCTSCDGGLKKSSSPR